MSSKKEPKVSAPKFSELGLNQQYMFDVVAYHHQTVTGNTSVRFAIIAYAPAGDAQALVNLRLYKTQNKPFILASAIRSTFPTIPAHVEQKTNKEGELAGLNWTKCPEAFDKEGFTFIDKEPIGQPEQFANLHEACAYLDADATPFIEQAVETLKRRMMPAPRILSYEEAKAVQTDAVLSVSSKKVSILQTYAGSNCVVPCISRSRKLGENGKPIEKQGTKAVVQYENGVIAITRSALVVPVAGYVFKAPKVQPQQAHMFFSQVFFCVTGIELLKGLQKKGANYQATIRILGMLEKAGIAKLVSGKGITRHVEMIQDSPVFKGCLTTRSIGQRSLPIIHANAVPAVIKAIKSALLTAEQSTSTNVA